MNPRYQDGSFQTAADMLRSQQREFVEPLMQQTAANLGDTLAANVSFEVGQALPAAQNRDVPWREQDGTNQKLLLSMYREVQTLLRKFHEEVEGRMDKLFTQAIAEKYAELLQKRQVHRDLQSEKDRNWQWAKEYKLLATPADFEEPSLEYDVECAWKKMRAAHADECWRSFDITKACTERTSRKLARPPTCNKRQWTRSLRCFPDTRSSAMALFWRNSALVSKLGHSWSSDGASW